MPWAQEFYCYACRRVHRMGMRCPPDRDGRQRAMCVTCRRRQVARAEAKRRVVRARRRRRAARVARHPAAGFPLPAGSLVALRPPIPVPLTVALLARGFTLADLGRAFGVSRERVRQVVAKAGVPGRLGQDIASKGH